MFKFLTLNILILSMLILVNKSTSKPQTKRGERVIKVAAIQMNAVKFDKGANFKKAESMLREASSKGADIACLPECALTGYPRLNRKRLKTEEEYNKELKKILSIAEPIPGPYSKKFAQLAEELGIYIITGYEELRGGKVYNTCMLLNPKGEIIGKYSKIHLQDWMVDSGINHGDGFKVFNISIRDIKLKVGIIICYDVQVPESARMEMIEGADILFVPYCTNDFSKEIIHRVGEVNSVEEINKWLGLAINIWNNTPQPDRGGKSPFEISREYDIHSGG